MSNITRLPTIAGSTSLATQRDLQPRDLALIRRTVAADTNDDEFNLFISYCRALDLDPRRRQIYAFVYSKDKPDKRKMSIVVAIDGLRTIAARSGCYRPDEDEPRFEIDPALKGSLNPVGLVKAVVKVWQFAHGAWHPVTAAAYWDEYAPVKDEWVNREKTGNKVLDTTGKWGQMPRVMLAKVAEALALRKAWPDDFSGVHAEEEMARASADDLLPAEALQLGAIEDRLAKVTVGRAILIDWLDGKALDPVPVGKLADRIMAFVEANAEETSQLLQFQERNRHGLREFWAIQPNDALTLKKEIEARVRNVGGQP